MNVILFKAITTEEIIADLESQSKEYHEGIYLDMNNPPERKIAKDSAKVIKDLRKKLNRARIDIASEHKVNVEAEFKLLDERLAKANAPFDVLIDAYNAERTKALADEKARLKAIDDLAQMEVDHEFALLLNKTYEFDQAEIIRVRKAQDDQIANDAAKLAILQQTRLAEAKEQDKINAENARLANRDHVSIIRTEAKNDLMAMGVDEDTARKIVIAMSNGNIANCQINY